MSGNVLKIFCDKCGSAPDEFVWLNPEFFIKPLDEQFAFQPCGHVLPWARLKRLTIFDILVTPCMAERAWE